MLKKFHWVALSALVVVAAAQSYASSTGPNGSTISGTSGIAGKQDVAMVREDAANFLVGGDMTASLREAIIRERQSIAGKIGAQKAAQIADSTIALKLLQEE